MRDYKEKAGRILQAKEKVITSLKEGKSIVGDSSGITSAEYEAVCQEKDVLRDELNQAKYTMEQLKVDLQVNAEIEVHGLVLCLSLPISRKLLFYVKNIMGRNEGHLAKKFCEVTRTSGMC